LTDKQRARKISRRIFVLTQSYSHRTLKLIAICFLLSGATGLIYEVLWARMLGLVFGATTVAISAVLAAFMGGLALGSALAARFAARIKRPLRAYAFIEIAVGIYALAVPILFRGIDRVYAQVWQHFHPGFYGFAFSRFAGDVSAPDSHGVDGRDTPRAGGRSTARPRGQCKFNREALHMEPGGGDHWSDRRRLFPAAAVRRSRNDLDCRGD
jgi:signal transduction histidine kinase